MSHDYDDLSGPVREAALREEVAATDRALLTEQPARLADAVIDCLRRQDPFDAALTIAVADLPDVCAALIHLAHCHLEVLAERGEA